ncbi:MAG: hypothetical protein C0603_09805 [Denitrovibrio sp.]|nr:MAG: hypothetical protein C0603_09805 [Denitrovibrio sp.]
MNLLNNKSLNTFTDDVVSIFIHLPKTGGSTLGTFFRNITENYISTNTYNQCKEIYHLSQASSKTNRLILSGHAAFGLHQYFTDKQCCYLTILRSPIERLISHYRYDIIKGIINPEKVSFTDFTKIRDINPYVNTFGRGDLKKAKYFLENNVALFGLQEKYNDFLFLLKKLYNLEYAEAQSINVSSSYKVNFTSEQIKHAEKALETEIEFYEFAKDLYNSRYSNVDLDISSVVVTSNESSKTKQFKKESLTSIASKKSKKEADYVALANINIQEGKLDNAEMHLLTAMELENKDFSRLLDFYYTHDLYKYAALFKKSFKNATKYITDSSSDINKLIFSKAEGLKHCIISQLRKPQPDIQLIKKLVSVYEVFDYKYIDDIIPYLYRNERTLEIIDNTPKLAKKAQEVLDQKLNNVEKIIIGGTGINACILNNICEQRSIKILGFLDNDTNEIEHLGKKVITSKDIDTIAEPRYYSEINGKYNINRSLNHDLQQSLNIISFNSLILNK